MKLTRTRAALPRVEWLESTGSTISAMRELLADEGDAVPHGALLATGRQTAGRGRLGRGWVSPPDTALAMSVLVRGFGAPAGAPAGAAPVPLGWLPLLAGSAVASTLQPLVGTGLRVGVKWPNDVHVRSEDDAESGSPGQKICGILCEGIAPTSGVPGAVPDVIVGIGINVLVPEWELPTERATSLLALDGDVGGAESFADPLGEDLADRLLAGVAVELLSLVELARRDPAAARRRALRHSLTLGAEVRVHLPGGELVDGRARTLADDGALILDLPTGGQLTVSAADVEHLR